MDWHEIQPQLHKCKADVLLLLDCCYSAQAARGRVREDPGKCELLAACAMKVQTPPPGPTSFTMGLLHEMSEMLEIGGRVVTSQLASRLTHQRAKLRQTPIYVDMSLGHEGRCIRWKSFASGTRQPALSYSEPASHLKLRVTVSASQVSQEKSLGDLVRWLKNEAPSVVKEIALDEIVLQTEQLKQIALGHDKLSNETPLVSAMDTVGKEGVLAVWKQVEELIADVSQTWAPMMELNSLEKVSDLKEKILLFIQELESRKTAVTQKLEAEVLALPDETYKTVASSSAAKLLGIDTPLQLRSLIMSQTEALESLRIDPHDIKSVGVEKTMNPGDDYVIGGTLKTMNVLVEYRTYQERPIDEIRAGRQIEKLARILNSAKPAEYLSLSCLHWLHDSYMRRYGLVFNIPSRLSLPVTSLFELIQTTRGIARPSIGQRFRIAYEVGRAIQKWHSVGLVHEGICSRNVIFFQNNDSSPPTTDFSRPFLGGFEFTRLEREVSDNHYVEDFEHNVYRHPDRQGAASQRHEKFHDIYAYGVFLLEIGVWQTVTHHRYFQGFRNGEELWPDHMRAILVKIAKQSLRHFMGVEYLDAVRVCLEDSLKDIEDDYRTQPKLAGAFEARVLDQVAKGRVLK